MHSSGHERRHELPRSTFHEVPLHNLMPTSVYNTMSRLNIMRPTRQQLETYAQTHEVQLTNGITELVSELHRREVDVYLVGVFNITLACTNGDL